MNSGPTRPVLRWHGGKWLLAPWVIQYFPSHRVYVEAYGGAASILLRKKRAYAEIYNDLDMEVVNLFEVLRSKRAGELVKSLRLTPFSRVEFENSYVTVDDPVERARKLVARSFMGFGSNAHISAVNTGFRASSKRSGSTPAHDWGNYPDSLGAIIERFQKVVIENRPAIQLIERHDGDDVLYLLDPPYMHETRSAKSRSDGSLYHGYNHEMTDGDHGELLETACHLKGMVILCGYPTDLYEDMLGDWHRVERNAHADGARERTEVLWINEAAWAARNHELVLFDDGISTTPEWRADDAIAGDGQ
jgi:DNA adenine methylase